MPRRTCPNCGNSEPDWNILEANCKNCGYSFIKIIDAPTDYQTDKINKHRGLIEINNERNWIFTVDEKELIEQVATAGSCISPYRMVVTFPYEVGYKQTDPSYTTKWAAIVLHDNPEKSHAFPVDPQKFDGKVFTCVNCNHVHHEECPIECSECGKHPWIIQE